MRRDAARGDDERRAAIDPNIPQAAFVEPERDADGTVRDVLTVLTTGRECVFDCVFCDLWKNTLPHATPPGALVRQLDAVLAAHRPVGRGIRTIKLYNASNWFDPKAVPPTDEPAIAERLEGFDRVVVESHPKLCGPPAKRFADHLRGRLEVAVGLETAEPDRLARLSKAMDVGDFEAACERLIGWGIAVRTFLLVPPPFAAGASDQEIGERLVGESIRAALEQGVGVVSLVPLRPGRLPDSSPPTYAMVRHALRSVALDWDAIRPHRLLDGDPTHPPRLFVDLWDAHLWCDAGERKRLEAWNRTQRTDVL